MTPDHSQDVRDQPSTGRQRRGGENGGSECQPWRCRTALRAYPPRAPRAPWRVRSWSATRCGRGCCKRRQRLGYVGNAAARFLSIATVRAGRGGPRRGRRTGRMADTGGERRARFRGMASACWSGSRRIGRCRTACARVGGARRRRPAVHRRGAPTPELQAGRPAAALPWVGLRRRTGVGRRGACGRDASGSVACGSACAYLRATRASPDRRHPASAGEVATAGDCS